MKRKQIKLQYQECLLIYIPISLSEPRFVTFPAQSFHPLTLCLFSPSSIFPFHWLLCTFYNTSRKTGEGPRKERNDSFLRAKRALLRKEQGKPSAGARWLRPCQLVLVKVHKTVLNSSSNFLSIYAPKLILVEEVYCLSWMVAGIQTAVIGFFSNILVLIQNFLKFILLKRIEAISFIEFEDQM